jgi:DNA-3-methyladenine glycosylase II
MKFILALAGQGLSIKIRLTMSQPTTAVFSDPVMAQLAQRVLAHLGVEALPTIVTPAVEEYFGHLCENIIGQQLSEKVAPQIVARAKVLVGGSFTPESVTAVTVEQLRAAGLSNAKARYLHALAEAWQSGLVPYHDFPNLDNETVIQELVKVKGIGRWTAEMFLIFTLGRPDVFSPGDYGLKRAMINAYELDEKVSAAELIKLAEQWQPHRSLACRILWRSLDI